ncbi:META domain-containing protein [Orbus sturtevantii]|uniref:META domain-containing protein n=1 Tax=Orbus sturtevantii TaxID=3074109 RepID=UPI00370D81C6
MKYIYYFFTLFTGVIILSACDNKQPSIGQNLAHHRFTVIELNNEKIINSKQTFIEFGENSTVNGQMCNQFFGQANITKNRIEIPHLASTNRLCSDEQLNKLDLIMSQLLQYGAIANLNQELGELTLKNDEYELKFRQKDLM